jgi:hypothetical protein
MNTNAPRTPHNDGFKRRPKEDLAKGLIPTLKQVTRMRNKAPEDFALCRNQAPDWLTLTDAPADTTSADTPRSVVYNLTIAFSWRWREAPKGVAPPAHRAICGKDECGAPALHRQCILPYRAVTRSSRTRLDPPGTHRAFERITGR